MKVLTKMIDRYLCKQLKYVYRSKKFKSGCEKEIKKLDQELSNLNVEIERTKDLIEKLPCKNNDDILKKVKLNRMKESLINEISIKTNEKQQISSMLKN